MNIYQKFNLHRKIKDVVGPNVVVFFTDHTWDGTVLMAKTFGEDAERVVNAIPTMPHAGTGETAVAGCVIDQFEAHREALRSAGYTVVLVDIA